jgi:hypothetical protein
MSWPTRSSGGFRVVGGFGDHDLGQGKETQLQATPGI